MKKVINSLCKIMPFSLLLASLAYGTGGQLGNGADAIVCRSGFKFTAELLDIYEARVLLDKKWSPDFYSQNYAGEMELARRALGPLDEKLKVKSARLREYLGSFQSEAVFVPNANMTDVDDALQVAIPAGCELVQLVIQIPNPLAGQKRYTVNQDVWDMMDDENHAATMLHEVIYRDQQILGHTDSRWTRYLNALLFSNEISKMSPQDVNALLRAGFKKTFIVNGFELLDTGTRGQSLFQILRALPSAQIPAQVIDGRYDVANGLLLDYTTTGKDQAIGIQTDTGLGYVLGADHTIKRVYASEAQLSNELVVSYLGYGNTDSAARLVAIDGLDSSGNFILKRVNRLFVGARFQFGTVFSEVVKGFRPGATIADWLANNGCKNGECIHPDNYLKTFKLFGPGAPFNEVAKDQFFNYFIKGDQFSYQGNRLTAFLGFGGFHNRVPAGAELKYAQYWSTYNNGSLGFMRFLPNGGISMSSSLGGLGGGIFETMMKDGSIKQIQAGQFYDLEFDTDLYLISVH